MTRSYLSWLFMSLPAILLTACGGGSSAGESLLPASGSSTGAVPLSVTFQVPGPATQSGKRMTQYVSAGTTSAKLTVTDANGAAASTVSNCTSLCELATTINPGRVQLAIQLYSGKDASGQVLSTGQMSTLVAAGQTNAIKATLTGVVAALSIDVASPVFTLGTAGTTSIQVNALDASGNRIVGSDAFATPITLGITGNTGSQFSLATSTVASADRGAVALSFNGGSVSATPFVTASIGGTAIQASSALTLRTLVTLPRMQAVSAAAFVDSVGVNTHLTYPVYANSFGTVVGMLNTLGIKHIRDGFVNNTVAAHVYFDNLKLLQSNGIRGTMGTQLNMPASTVLANVVAAPGFTEAIEAPNEYDLSGDPNWSTKLSAYQRTLYTDVKAIPSISTIPVIGPALTTMEAYARLGNLSAYMDQGNMHDYFAGYNPGTEGYGGGAFGALYGSIKFNIGAAAQTSGTKPVVATETGYCTLPNTRNAITPVIGSKYVPRMYLEQWLAKVPRTLTYELIDEGGSGCDSTYGLVTNSLQPKPAFQALRSLLSTVRDSAALSPGSLPLSLTTTAKTVHSLLLQKSNGNYVLALWNEVSGWNVNAGTGTPVATAPVAVTLTLGATPAQSTSATINDAGTLSTNDLAWTSGTANLTIDDHVTLLTLTP